VYFSNALGGGGGKPTGLSLTGATLNSSSTFVGTPASWVLVPFDSGGYLQASYSTGNTQVNGTIIFDGITNSSSSGVYYISVSTYPDRFCTTPTDFGYGLFANTDGVVVNATDPTLTFSLR
jgi:hypothetical protein